MLFTEREYLYRAELVELFSNTKRQAYFPKGQIYKQRNFDLSSG